MLLLQKTTRSQRYIREEEINKGFTKQTKDNEENDMNKFSSINNNLAYKQFKSPK